ncbi:MAG: hypothetical protein AAF721_34490 [Myxococcota bacterium]
MSTRSVTLTPACGWEAFTRSAALDEVAWEVLATWHYMNPTSKTSIWESETGATFYLAFGDSGAVIEAVAGHAAEPDPELDALLARLVADFSIR